MRASIGGGEPDNPVRYRIESDNPIVPVEGTVEPEDDKLSRDRKTAFGLVFSPKWTDVYELEEPFTIYADRPDDVEARRLSDNSLLIVEDMPAEWDLFVQRIEKFLTER